MKARVNTFLNIRTGTPEILPNNNPNDAYYKPGDEVEITKTIVGQLYQGNDIWHQTDAGIFISNFGTDIPKDLFFPKKRAISTTNDLTKKITLNNPTITNSGRGITIGIMDSGIDISHPDLKFALTNPELNYLESDENLLINGHGTKIAGLLAGNSAAVSGLAIDSKIRSFRVIKGNNNLDDVALKDALDDLIAKDYEIDILNLSFEINENSLNLLTDAFNKLIKRNIILVLAGNLRNSLEMNPLSKLNNIIAVGTFNTDTDLKNAPKEIDVSFINGPITTTDINGATEKFSPFEDTSAYTAIVTGLVARFLSNVFINKEKRLSQVKDYIRNCSFDIEQNIKQYKPYKNAKN